VKERIPGWSLLHKFPLLGLLQAHADCLCTALFAGNVEVRGAGNFFAG
jgi:hypothetical protein